VTDRAAASTARAGQPVKERAAAAVHDILHHSHPKSYSRG
jgi:hypothetical protein